MDLLVTDPVTGRKTGLTASVRRALKAMAKARLPYCVIGATALAVRGLPRMTRDLDLAVPLEEQLRAAAVLRAAGFRATTPVGSADDPEPMVVFVDPTTDVEVDLMGAAGDPERTVIREARPAMVFGARAPVASLEHLLLLYLYSNQPRHLGDFASIVQSGKADLPKAERMLHEMHREMVPAWRRRVKRVLAPPPPPSRPKPRKLR